MSVSHYRKCAQISVWEAKRLNIQSAHIVAGASLNGRNHNKSADVKSIDVNEGVRKPVKRRGERAELQSPH